MTNLDPGSIFEALGRPDPTPWILESDEPQARWVALAHLSPDIPTAKRAAELKAAHAAVLAHPATREILDLLPGDWASPASSSGHHKPELATNLLDLIADIGVAEADDPRIGGLLDGMLAHTDADGRFLAHAAQRTGPPVWGCLPCDTHAIADVLGRFGRAGDPRVKRALSTAASDLVATDLGLAWLCRPDAVTGFRGPGRASEPCPQTTLEALRAISGLPVAKRPAWLPDVAHTSLEIWRQRGTRKPYMMGHGRQFKTVKWPTTWYGAYEIVDVLARLPEAWLHRPDDRRSIAEIAACLLAYNVASDGRVTPLSTFNGWERLSLGQKKRPSPLATALIWSRLALLEEIAAEIASIDVMRLGSSKGGSGTPIPPRIG
jgi:hypothetical protein